LQSITRPIELSVASKVTDPHQCLTWVTEINDAYRALNRPRQKATQIVDLKLRTILWRSRILNHLLTRPPPWAKTDPGHLARILTALNICLTPHQQELAAGLLSSAEIAGLMANQGITPVGHPDLWQTSGPGINLNIVANRSSSWPFHKWRRNNRFSRYQSSGEGVRYRGVCFLPGDVLLANVNLDGNGIYTSLSDPRSFSSHSAFFAILEYHGDRFPVVIETYEKGVRPVPLNVFLGPRFCSYVEVYRHHEYSQQHAAAINKIAAEFIENVRGYNFDSEDRDPAYMSCTAVGRFLHQRSGLTPARTMSKLDHPNVRNNLSKLGYTYFDFFAPVDFLLNDCFRFAGRIDNNQIDRLLARELVDKEFRRQFRERDLDPRRFPFPYRLNRWGLGHMRRNTVIGKAIGLVEGFDPHNLPKGPDDLLAVIKIAEKQIGAVISKTRIAIERTMADHDNPDLASLMNSPELNSVVERSLNLSWLPPKTSIKESRIS
jgi:hypothetical protein